MSGELLVSDLCAASRISPEKRALFRYEKVGNHLLVGREGEACEIARAYLFFMEEGYSTGQTIVVDGGALLM